MMNSTIDEIEGIDQDIDDSLGEYPIDTVLIRNESRTVHDVLRRIEKGGYIMDPDFQRDFIWSVEKQSKLIESILMRIPLPVFYLAENSEGRMVVVDGLQRLSTFRQFVNNKLKLKLPKQKELNGKIFNDLPPKLQNRIEDCNLILYQIDSKVPTQALLDIFDRVNSGEPLSRQQMRNCLFMGNATKFLKSESSSDIFIQATGKSLKPEKMRDREFINRYCAFKLLRIEQYTGDMDDFLANALKKMNSLNERDIERLSLDFKTSMKNNVKVFNRHAFRKHSSLNEGRIVINASLWDVMSVGLSQYSENIVEARAEQLRAEFYELLKNQVFLDAITLGTNQVSRVKDRFSMFNQLLSEVLDD